MQGFGFNPDQIDMAIVKAYRKKLLETSARIIPQPGTKMPQTMRITTIGSYHIERLCKLLSYVDAIIVDTPIIDNNFKDKIFNVSDIEDRLKGQEYSATILILPGNQLKMLQLFLIGPINPEKLGVI